MSVEGGGPHEWGYRDITSGKFISDDWPFRAAEALEKIAQLSGYKSSYQCAMIARDAIRSIDTRGE